MTITNAQLWRLLSVARDDSPVMPLFAAADFLKSFGATDAEVHALPTFRWGDRVGPAQEGAFAVSSDAEGVESWRVVAFIANKVVGKEYTPSTARGTSEELALELVNAFKFFESELGKSVSNGGQR